MKLRVILMLKVKVLNDLGMIPVRANPTDAGADLISPEDVIVRAHSNRHIGLGIAVEIPEGCAGFIYARSGLGTKHGIVPRNCVGVIDSKFRNELGVTLSNDSAVPYMIRRGDRIAQIVIAPVFIPVIKVVTELDMTDDRNGGFGSTGV